MEPVLLGFDTTTPKLSIAVSKGGNVLSGYSENTGEPHSIILLPKIGELIHQAGVAKLDGIVTVTGPGSFTGVRIAISTAQGLAEGNNLPVVGLNSLELLAWSTLDKSYPICPIIPASSEDVYTALYKWNNDTIEEMSPPEVLEWDELYSKISEPTLFMGWGARKFVYNLKEYLGEYFIFSDNYHPNIKTMMELGLREWKSGKAVQADKLVPYYLRQSQAEMRLNKLKQFK